MDVDATSMGSSVKPMLVVKISDYRNDLNKLKTELKRLSSSNANRAELLGLPGLQVAYDIVEDMMVLGDHMRETLQQLQDAVHVTKTNIVRYNEENLVKIDESTHYSVRSQLSSVFSNDTSIPTGREYGGPLSLSSKSKDMEMPMPPLTLAPLLYDNIRSCDASDLLSDLVDALKPLAHMQQRIIQLCELPKSLEVAVEEPALRQALGNLIEGALLRTNVGGMVGIVSTSSPAGGVLIIIDDDGPDMHYMTQMHSLTPFGAKILSNGNGMVEDNMTWNFVAGLTVAREILENYGCVLRVISPRLIDAPLGVGGTRVEIWFPSFSSAPDGLESAQTA